MADIYLLFLIQLSQLEINLEKLQRVATTGLPDGGGLRATTWKVHIHCSDSHILFSDDKSNIYITKPRKTL